MKNSTPKILFTLCAILPLLILGNGCQNKNDQANSDSSNSSLATNSSVLNADNSGKNARDNNSGALTPGDQGNSDSDVKITQQIRQQVVSETNHYSMTAKNIKIITVQGKVTLRGPVNNDTEKSGIDSIAKMVAGEGNVIDQLEVTTNSP